jgi:hypothetical protein
MILQFISRTGYETVIPNVVQLNQVGAHTYETHQGGYGPNGQPIQPQKTRIVDVATVSVLS